MIFLRKSTASQEIMLGPFLDSTDGDTEMPSLTIANTDIHIWLVGSSTLNHKNSGGATYVSNGLYSAVLDATDTGSVGSMKIFVHVSGALPVELECAVLSTSEYDDKFGTTFTASSTIYAAVTGIGTSGGAAINTDCETANVTGGITGVTSGTTFKGTQSSGTFANTSVLDGTRHIITGTDTGNTIFDIVYQFLCGGGTTPVGLIWTGIVNSNDDTMLFWAWDHENGLWETIGSLLGQTSSITNVVKNIVLYPRHIGTSAAELGKVYIRLSCTGSTPIVRTDQVYVTYAVTSRSVGYSNGAVWLDTVNGVTGVELYVNGTADKPTKTWAEALSIAASIGVKTIQVINGSSIVLSSDTSHYTFLGDGYVVDLNGQDVSDAVFVGAWIHGVGLGTGFDAHYGIVNACTLPVSTHLHFMAMTDTVTLGGAGSYIVDQCYSTVGGDGETLVPMFDFVIAGSSCNVAIRHFSGVIRLKNMIAGDLCSVDGDGGVITEAGCTGGTLVLHGALDLHDNASGVVTVTDTARWNESQSIAGVSSGTVDITASSVDAILDEVVEGSITLRQALRLVMSVLAGKVSGSPTGPIVFQDIGDTKPRITATVDADGNRLTVTMDAT